MSFDSTSFMIFLVGCFAGYWLMRTARSQNLLLVFASLTFYGWFDWRCLGLIVGLVGWTYCWGVSLGSRHARSRLALSILGPIATLGFFKYFNFFIGTINSLSEMFHMSLSSATLSLVLPVGISFYTFMAISYLVDVYQKRILPERSVLDFSAYMCFFPQLVAGPIGRAPEMLPQFKTCRMFDEGLAIEACRQILWGAFAKFVVADNCNVIASTLLGCSQLSRWMVILGGLAYTIQIYGDFSGYSNMAVGIGKLFGIRLRQNFAYPYFATSFSDFWHRWHISLTTWFRDYVYFPLGGSRCSLGKTIRNTWIVFLLSGLWHGASWTFVAWGGLHALFLTGRVINKRLGVRLVLPLGLGWLLMFTGVILAWLLFQAPGFAVAWHYSVSLVQSCSTAVWPKVSMIVYAIAALSSGVLFAWERAGFKRGVEFGFAVTPSRCALRWFSYVVLTLLIVCCSGDGGAFIYQKF